MTDFDNIIYVSSKAGDDSNRGMLSEPLETIQAGIGMAAGYITDGLAETVDVYVAEGVYAINSGTGEGIVLSNKVSLYGGYKEDFSKRNADTYISEIIDLAESGEIVAAISGYETVTESCVIDGFTIRGGDTDTNGGWTFAIQAIGSFITIRNNRIFGGSSPVTGLSVGVDVYNGGTSVIENNFIHGGTSQGLCVAVLASTNITTTIRGNDIQAGNGGNCQGVTVLNGSAGIYNNVIDGGDGVQTDGVKISGTSVVTVESNTICGGDASDWARGVLIYSNNVNVRGNLITGGTSTGAITGISCQDIGWVIIRNNLVFGGEYIGSSTDYDADGIMLHRAGAMIYNNTVAGGLSDYNSAVRIQSESSASIENNILFSLASVTGFCVGESASNGDNVTSINNNNLYDYSGNTLLYRTFDTNNYDTGVAVNALEYASGNRDEDPAFVDLDGPDDDITTMDDNDWHLTSATPVEVRQGGLDGIVEGWGFNTDLDGISRTDFADGPDDGPSNDGAAGWSMGAYEKD